MAQFEDEDAAIAQQIARLFDQPAVNFDTGAAAEQGLVRLVVADFALQVRCLFERNVRRIADDQVEERFRRRGNGRGRADRGRRDGADSGHGMPCPYGQ